MEEGKGGREGGKGGREGKEGRGRGGKKGWEEGGNTICVGRPAAVSLGK